MNKIKGKFSGEIDVKRFYLPGVIIVSDCPTCGRKHEMDMSSDYISYPTVGGSEDIHFYCDDDTVHGLCDTEWKVPIVLGVTVKINNKENK